MKIRILVKPNARQESITSQQTIGEGTVYVVQVKAPPIDGKANRAVLKLFSKKLGIAKSHLSISSGQTSRYKLFQIDSSAPLDEKKIQELLS